MIKPESGLYASEEDLEDESTAGSMSCNLLTGVHPNLMARGRVKVTTTLQSWKLLE